MDETTMTDRHGVEVLTRRWLVDRPRGVVLLSHGASEHSGRYDRFARALGEAGLAVLALDHRGHGGTTSPAGPGRTGPGGGAALVEDLQLLREEAVRAVGPDVPVLLFAHSMGTLVALPWLVQHSAGLAGAVLCGFPSDLDGVAQTAEVLRGVAEGGLRDAPYTGLSEHGAAVEGARTPFDWLSRDPDEVDRYLADPLCGDGNPLTWGYLVDLFEVVAPAAEQLAAVRCPVLVVAGDQDPAAARGAHPRALADRLQQAGVPVDLRLYEGARHELLNETNRDEVTADLVAWLTARAAAR